ncbi:hypothetical protein ACLB2K_074774 [Fragaria x ananassa]
MQGLCFSHRLVTPATHRLCPVPVIGISTRTSSSTLSSTDAKKFEEASKHGNLVPLYRCLFSDQLTPVLAYRCLVKEDDREALSFLFESVEQSTQVFDSDRHALISMVFEKQVVLSDIHYDSLFL